jgi:hypothetical protein
MSQTEKNTMVTQKPEKVFINKKFYDRDFSNQDLTHADFRGCTLVSCNFDHSDLSYATFEGANCYRSSFNFSRLYHTSFKDAVTAEVSMDPREMFGLTLSVSCDAFDKLKIGKMWLAAWLFLPLLAQLPDGMDVKIRGVLVELIGEERLKGMERHFADRQL